MNTVERLARGFLLHVKKCVIKIRRFGWIVLGKVTMTCLHMLQTTQLCSEK